jgi:hypothetical protein
MEEMLIKGNNMNNLNCINNKDCIKEQLNSNCTENLFDDFYNKTNYRNNHNDNYIYVPLVNNSKKNIFLNFLNFKEFSKIKDN